VPTGNEFRRQENWQKICGLFANTRVGGGPEGPHKVCLREMNSRRQENWQKICGLFANTRVGGGPEGPHKVCACGK
jgi:hypothetical protein